MIIKILVVIIVSILSGFAYRAGGGGWNMNTKVRDWGCPLLALGLWWYLKGLNLGFWWAYLATFLLTWGTMTTYFKKRGSDATWLNWGLHGLALGLASFPLIWVGVPIWAIGIRSVVCGGLMIWCGVKIDNDFVGEMGRGAIFMATLPLMLL